ncbi:acyl-CoA dehydrogenase family protein [Amycolatopsis mediterranei]|uniref:acyl-CoA dehydrogenase family protein n=1 Tax=Amycolatopsis mediterranei TaxID=33910 RepID=UPI00341DACC7
MVWERACLFALFLGVQNRLIEHGTGHARERRRFGRRISDFQAVSHRLADAKLRVNPHDCCSTAHASPSTPVDRPPYSLHCPNSPLPKQCWPPRPAPSACSAGRLPRRPPGVRRRRRRIRRHLGLRTSDIQGELIALELTRPTI